MKLLTKIISAGLRKTVVAAVFAISVCAFAAVIAPMSAWASDGAAPSKIGTFSMTSQHAGTVTFELGNNAGGTCFQYLLAEDPAFTRSASVKTSYSKRCTFACSATPKTVYGKVRSSRMVGGERVWGPWSKAKKATTRQFVIGVTGSIAKHTGGWMNVSGAKAVRIKDEDVDVAKFDALLIPGGNDVDPQLYGQEPDEHTDVYDKDVDEFEIAVFNKFVEAKKPVLGICRGMQLFNVALGGTLVQHIPGRHWGDRVVTVQEGSWLYDTLGPSMLTYHYHHQCLDVLGEGLVATEWDEQDGRVEAVEHQTLPIYGLQWHPDGMEGWGHKVAQAFMTRCAKDHESKNVLASYNLSSAA